jgi:DNA-binding transcriptional regulator GbsR (MarR family)
MSEKETKRAIVGVKAGGNITIGNNSGQLAIGNNIKQIQITKTKTLTLEDKKALFDNLEQFQKEITKLNLSIDEKVSINNDVISVAKEAEKEKPDESKIQARFQSALETIKKAGDTLDTVSKWEWTKRIVKILGKLGLTFLL